MIIRVRSKSNFWQYWNCVLKEHLIDFEIEKTSFFCKGFKFIVRVRSGSLITNPPAPKVLGRDRPDGTRKRLQVYLGGGAIIRPKPPVFDRSWRSPSKNTVKNSTEDTCSWTRPSKIGKRKVKKTRVFQLFDLNFLVCNIFFCGSAGGLARRQIFEFLDPFSDWFSSFCDSRNTGFYSVFLFSACLTASFKTSKNLVNYAVLCYGVNENIVNTSVFWRWLKKHCKLQCFWPPDPQKPWYLQWFLLLTAQKHCK